MAPNRSRARIRKKIFNEFVVARNRSSLCLDVGYYRLQRCTDLAAHQVTRDGRRGGGGGNAIKMYIRITNLNAAKFHREEVSSLFGADRFYSVQSSASVGSCRDPALYHTHQSKTISTNNPEQAQTASKRNLKEDKNCEYKVQTPQSDFLDPPEPTVPGDRPHSGSSGAGSVRCELGSRNG